MKRKSNIGDLGSTLEYTKFIQMLSKELTVPENLLRISANIKLDTGMILRVPFEFKLSKQDPKLELSE